MSNADILEQQISRWEDQRALKNLMGIYSNYIILNWDGTVFENLWSKTQEDVSLGLNDGWYLGREAVAGYYAAVRNRNALVAELLQKKFTEEIGDKTPEEIFGIGTFRVFPVSCPVIEIAGDRKTAKGLWYCMGSHAEVKSVGPTSNWTWGYYAADFIREGTDWKLWHLQYVNDVDARCGTSWGEIQEPMAELPEFQALAEYQFPAYTRAEANRAYYAPDRPLTGAPRMPEPYETFAETFSYGM